MDKQKQIEEMAKILQRLYNCYGEFNAEWFAEHLAVNNIGKIPENAVVLTEEKYGNLVTRPNLHTAIDVFEARKETAEKFAERLTEGFTKAKNAFKGASETVRFHDKMMFHKGEERAMEKAIEFVNEICKEITEGKV